MFGADGENVSARLFRHFPELALATAAETHHPSRIESVVNVIDAVDDCVCPLRLLDRGFDVVSAALIFAVGNQDQRLTPDLSFQLLVGGEVNRIIEQRSFR